MPENIDVQTTPLEGGGLTVRARGEFDMTTSGPLRSALRAAVESAPSRLVVDLSQVTFMDTVALGALIAGFKGARAAGIPFSVPSPHPTILRVLTIMGLASLFAVREEGTPTQTADAAGGAPVTTPTSATHVTPAAR